MFEGKSAPKIISGKVYLKLILTVVFVLIYSNHCEAQNMLFSPVGGSEQLNEEQIRHIIQLKDGRLGVFTEGMLNLYNGSGFKTIHINDENTIPVANYTGFHHGYVENNRLWFKNSGKLAIINLNNERATANPAKIFKALGFKNVPADLFVDNESDIWVLTDKNALLCRENKTGKVTAFLKDITLPSLPIDRLYDVIRHDNKVYLFYRSGMVRCFNRLNSKELYRTTIASSKADNFKDWLHVTIVNQYLYVVRGGYYKGQLVRYDTASHKSQVLLQADDYWLNCFAANKNGDFFMSSRNGLWHFDTSANKKTFHETIDLTNGDKIKTEVSTVYYDNQGGFWVGTFNKGLYYYHPDRFRFQTFEKKDFNLAKTAELQVNCFQETVNGKLIIGTNNGVYTGNLPTGFSVLLANVYCNHLYKDKTGKVWISTRSGLFILDKKGVIIKLVPYPVNYIFENKNGDLYACSPTNGLLKYNTVSGSFTTLQTVSNLPNITQATEWNNCIVGISGKGPFIIKNNTLTLPLENRQKRPPFFGYFSHKYTCLLADSENDLWTGTYDGLTMWSTKDQKLYELHVEDGLANNSIKAIAEDTDHSYWVTTSRGVSHITKKYTSGTCSFIINSYNNYTGVLQHAFAERSIFLSSGSTLYTGGIDGMNVLQPNKKASTLQLDPVILSLKIFGNKGFEKLVAYSRNVTLSFNQNFFGITFSGLNYSNPSQTYYRYSLQGVDEGWREQKTHLGIGNANYTNIAPGDYIFKVQASPDGVSWSGPVKTIYVSITPPWWKTGYAYAAYIIFTLAITFLTARRITLDNRKRRQKQQELAIEQAKTDFITNISHELRTPLTMVITPLRALLTKVTDGKTKKDLELINNNAQLMLDTVTQLLEFKKMDSGNEILHRHFYDNLLFLEELCTTYSQLASEKPVKLVSDIFAGEVNIFIDRQKITRIIINLLSNAIKFTPPGGTVMIKVTPDEALGTLKIVVEDTGVGIKEEELESIFDRFYQARNQNGSISGSGIGLFMVRQYAQLHEGSVTASSTQGSGTTFKVTLSVKDNVRQENHVEAINKAEKTVLIAEDNKAFRDYLAAELKTSYNIITCANGKVALEEAVKNVPDIIISDMMMPEMTGPEFCRALRNDISVSHIPVIMLTGRTSDEARYEGYEAGADAYLVKPFDINVLRIRIEKLLQVNESRKKAFLEEKVVKAEEITTNPLDRDLLDRALKYVAKNIANPDYSVEKFSADMGMDRTGLYRKLLALTGYSPINFIRTIRLKKAAELLTAGRMPIAEIAEAAGFNSLSYFSKCFHESFAKTPSQYREEKNGAK